MFLMCPLTLTSPSLYLLLIGHPWWLSHLVLKTVGCILSAQGPLGGYSSSSSLVLGGQGQSLCLSPCPSTLHTSLEFLLHLPPWKWGTLALLGWNAELGQSRCLTLNSSRKEWCSKTYLTRTHVKPMYIAIYDCCPDTVCGCVVKKNLSPKWLSCDEHVSVCVHFCYILYSCKVVNLALFRCGVYPVASKSTVYLLCIALLLLPAHVCLGFWDRSPGPSDHTCGERELGTRASSSMTKKKKKKKNKKL